MANHQNKFNCFIIGEGTLPIQCAEILINQGHVIYGIISADASIINWAEGKNIPYIKPTDHLGEFLSQQPFDYLFSIVNRYVLPQEILELPRQFAINYHDAPLPRYAGVNATSWALMNQEKTHGVTWHIMAAMVDAGDILKQVIIDIADDETALTLNGKCYESAINAFAQLVDELSSGTFVATKVNLNQRTYFSRFKRLRAGGIISWKRCAYELDALIRALDFGSYPNPLGRPKLAIDSNLFIVSKLEVQGNLSNYPPGTITNIEPTYITVSTASYDIALRQVLAINSQALSISYLVEKFGLQVGYQFCDLEPNQVKQIEKFDQSIVKHEAFWVERLGILESITIPEAKQTASLHLKEPQYARARMFVPDEAITLWLQRHPQWHRSDFLAAAFITYLARIGGSGCFDIGFKDIELQRQLVGLESLFASVVPYRVNIDYEQSFAALKKQFEFTQLPLTYVRDVVTRYPSLRSLSDHRGSEQFFPVVVERVEKLEDYQSPLGSDLTFIISSDGKKCCWFYNTDILNNDSIARMQEQFTVFLQGILTEPDQCIAYLPLLSEQQRREILLEWNDTQVDDPQDKCIHQLFESQVDLTPDAVAVVFENQQLTYHELNCRANQLAHYLQSLGVGTDVLVGICVERSLEMVVGLLGILKAGGAYVPLDPEYPTERLTFMLADAQVSVLLTQQHLVEKLPENQEPVVCLDTDWLVICESSQESPITEVQPGNLAYVIYTSGSTGTPKGVMLSHSNLCNHMSWMQATFPLTEKDKVLQKTPFGFDASVWEFYAPLLAGGQLLIAKPGGHTDSAYLLRLIAQQQVTIVQLVPSLLQMLLEQGGIETCHSLKHVFCGGEVLPVALLEGLLSKLDVNLHNLYGPTETCIDATFCNCQREIYAQIVPIGRPISNTQIYILDQNLQALPVGVPGELHISGAGLARGYLNRPELTQEKFIANPFSTYPGSRLYKTGDLARYLPNGNIEYLGRIDNQVKIRGFRIELAEIEAVLNQRDDVQVACVIAREDDPGNKRLVGYIVPSSQMTCTVSELPQFLKTKLPDYMVPNIFVILDSLPLTPNGKINRGALPVPDLQGQGTDKYVAPRTPTEEILSLIWAQVLKLEQVGIHDNFFTFGGHSLLATQLVSRIRTSFKVELPLRSLFAAPTVAQLSPHIQRLQQQELELTSPPILPRDENAELPLSYAQQRLWFLDQLQPNSSLYNIPIALRLVGTLNQAALAQSLEEIIHRHEALRTNFITVDGTPRQVIQTATNWTVSVVNFRHLSTSAQEIAAQQLAQKQAIQSFDLASEVLIRVTLVVLSETEHLLNVCMHHIVSDGWSMGVFVAELAALYNAYSIGLPSLPDATRIPLTPLPIQYADFAIWQRNWLVGDVLQSQLNYWQQQLKDAPALLVLPTDRPRPAVQTFVGAYQDFALSVELTQGLMQLSQQQDCTLFMTLLAAFDTLLYRYTGTEDILVGTPIANRDRSEIEGLIGFFVNTLVMRSNLSENPSFAELLTRVRSMALSAYAHQNLPLEMLVEALQPERDLSHTPLFQVMFALQNPYLSEVELSGLSISSLPIEGATAKFDLTLAMENTGNGLIGVWEYNTDLFDASTIERMTGHFLTLLSSIVANPLEQISQLPLLTEPEKQQLLIEWNHTQVDYPVDQCIHQLFEQQVRRTPDAVAVVFEEQQLTYHELNCRANQLAHYLQSLGVGTDVLVGICVERSLEMVVGLLGILKAGGAYVPLDPEYPTERLTFMLADAQVSVLLTQQHLVEKLPENQEPVVCLDTDWLVICESSQESPITEVQPGNLAYVIYTSGSTGTPKGVMLSHSNLCNHMSWMQATFPLTEKDKVLQKTPFGFDASVWEFYAPLLAGGQLLIAKPGGHTDSAYLLRLIAQQQVTIVQLVPSLLQMLLEQGGIETCHSLKHVFCGGEVLPVALLEGLLSKLDVNLHNLYGPTETCIDATFCNCQREIYAQIVPIGRPISNTQIYILDQNLQALPVGVPGELHISGAGLARGYLNRPELTQEKFIANPFSTYPGSRLYKTGDLARYLPNGNIEYLGRIDNQVKIRGFRIELAEIEAVLNQRDDVQVACVIAREDDPGNKRLVGYIVPSSQMTCTVSELPQFLKTKLPDYMVPNIFVILDSLPLTPNGKINRGALPVPDLQGQGTDKYVAPRTPTEEILSLIWAQVLKLEQVGIHDNFFTFGGHSLLATQLVSRIRTSFKVELPLRSLFAAPTVAQLSPHIQRLQQQELELTSPPILPRDENAELPLSYAQQRLWFLDQLQPNSSLYNIPIALRLVGTLNQAALAQSLEEIIHRHEALRTNFITVDGTPRQVIQTATNWTVSVVNFRHLSTSAQEIAAQQLAQKQAIQSFDLASEVLIRVTLVVLSETEHLLNVCMHHIVSDGWSMGVFVAELAALYNAYSIGLPSLPDATRIPLTPLPIQYADFAIWQRNWLVGDVLQSQLNYWQQQLKDAPALLVLPTDRPRPAVQTFVGAYQDFALSVELTQGLMQLSQQQDCTLFMTLLAAFDTLLYRYTGTEDILVGTPIANRDRSEIEGLIGFFVNTLVMRSNLSENPSFAELLTRVRSMALSAYAHQNLPLEMLVEALQPERDLSHTPLFQVMFALQNPYLSEVELSGLSISSLPIEGATAKFDLTLAMENTGNGLIGVWEYNTDLFDASTIERMTGHFLTLLSSIVANPLEQISQLPLLTEPEKQQLLIEWNHTQVDYPVDQCIHQLFEQQVRRTPDAVAVVFEEQQLTYHELNCRANQLAHYLQSLGVGADVLVGICVERSWEMIVGLLGILKAGGAYVPLDPEYPPERLSFILTDTQVKVLLTQQQLVNKLPAHTAQLVCLDTDLEKITQNSNSNPVNTATSPNLAYVIYTSGSTGQPKGVLVNHHHVTRLFAATNSWYKFNSQDVWTMFHSYAFDFSVWEIWGALLYGGRLVVVPYLLTRSPESFYKLLSQEQVTILNQTPSAFRQLIQAEQSIGMSNLNLRLVIFGGEALELESLQPWFERHGDQKPQLVNMYGITETTVHVTYRPLSLDDLNRTASVIGRPIPDLQVYVLDQHLQPVPIGVPGEMYVGGEGVTRGYLHRDELTGQRFISNPFQRSKGGERLYRTGDLARYLPNGELEYLGRIDQQVKIRGFRIELGEIEGLLAQHPAVWESVVVVREDEPSNKRLVAYVVPQVAQAPTTAELRSFLKKKLPDYMIPNAIVILESLPLTSNGKIDRRSLPVPESRAGIEESLVAPRTPVEEKLAQIWAKVLRVEQVGIHDNFFELGGHSLLATQLVSRIRTSFKVELPLRSLFAAPTVAELAPSIQQLQQQNIELKVPPILPRKKNAKS
ncbi:non-ribosomal peptide synthetase [Dolichospermum sp. UHCC 0299]|uniref:non-ribosomal peptide synthetase n=1 Tax=Dolichospermum sp. UHCC 0299 TaxID=2590014 RepID=UPI001C2CB46D|nr:non-ribosomal peptide synthetase [Dolichospermum sp. UHCC 0299]MTJ18651.1 amino acid adenylation domain-containing protein [Dolichospermum sp. UHCC 0299]